MLKIRVYSVDTWGLCFNPQLALPRWEEAYTRRILLLNTLFFNIQFAVFPVNPTHQEKASYQPRPRPKDKCRQRVDKERDQVIDPSLERGG